MKKILLSTLLLALPLLASAAYDIAVDNADGVTIYYYYHNNGTELGVTRNGKYSGVVNIPEEVTYMGITRKVTCIGMDAFKDCTGLTSITIPNSVTTIGIRAFQGCTDLTSVHITDIAAWCKIIFRDYDSNPLSYAHHIFMNGEEIKDLVIPNSVTGIWGPAFQGCTSLTSVTIPNTVTNIGDYAFLGCTGLTSVHITDIAVWCKIMFHNYYSNPLYYAHHLFLNGEEIKDLVIPNSVTGIWGPAFQGCTSLTSVTIPNTVTNIGNSAFKDCTGLTSITIPNSVTRIEIDAFSGCTGLTSVIPKMENPCYIDVYCFPGDVFRNATLYVPKGTVDKYKSKNYWNKFVYIEESDPTDIIQVSSDGLLISTQNGTITVRGEQNGLPLTVYSADGKLLGSATTKDGQVSISTNLQRGEIAIVKVGSKSVKIKM